MSRPPTGRRGSRSRTVLALGYVAAGLNHFRVPRSYEQVVPPMFPHPKLLVQVSGVAEVAGGVGVLLPATRRASGWGLVALLLAVSPVHVFMALHPEEALPERARGRVPRWALWARLPLQLVLMWWAWRETRA